MCRIIGLEMHLCLTKPRGFPGRGGALQYRVDQVLLREVVGRGGGGWGVDRVVGVVAGWRQCHREPGTSQYLMAFGEHHRQVSGLFSEGLLDSWKASVGMVHGRAAVLFGNGKLFFIPFIQKLRKRWVWSHTEATETWWLVRCMTPMFQGREFIFRNEEAKKGNIVLIISNSLMG